MWTLILLLTFPLYVMGVWVVVAHVPWPVLVLGFLALTAGIGRITDWLCDRFGPK